MLDRQTDRQTSETDFLSSSPYPSLLSFLPSTCCTSRRHCNATTCVSTTIFHTTFDQKMNHPHKRGHDDNIAANTKIPVKANTSPHKQPHPAHTHAHAHGSRKLKKKRRETNKQNPKCLEPTWPTQIPRRNSVCIAQVSSREEMLEHF